MRYRYPMVLSLLALVLATGCGESGAPEGRASTPGVDVLEKRVAEIRSDVDAARELLERDTAAADRLDRASLGLRQLTEYYLPLLAARHHLDRARSALSRNSRGVRRALDSVEAALAVIVERHGTHLEGEMREPLEWVQDVRTALGAEDTAAARRYLDRLDTHLESIFYRGAIVLEGSKLDRP